MNISMGSAAFSPDVSIVIKTYDNSPVLQQGCAIPTLKDILGGTLDIIAAQTLSPYEIVVVDSSAGDGIAEVVRRYESRLRCALRRVPLAPQQFSYPRALNLGVQQAKGEVVVSLSGDATPANVHWLARLVAPLAHTEVAGAFSRHVIRRELPLSMAERFRLWWRYRSRETTIRRQDAVFSNACSAFRRELALQFPFDETLHELEDYAWARTMQNRGMAIAYVGESEVLHSHTTSSARTLWRMVYYVYLRMKVDARLHTLK
ncbi:MAG: glycosyltransferase [Anaerolineae bacterium]|nr:glycosyltransferase [Anaerolineae bacterium]